MTSTVLFEERAYLEGPRVHDGQLFVANTFAGSVLCFDARGARRLVCQLRGVPCGLGFLPDGDLVVLEMRARKLWRWSRGTLSLYADLANLATGTIDDMIVDAQGRTFVGDLGFDLFKQPKPGAPCGQILLVCPDRAPRVVAEGLDFPNGIAVSGSCDRLAVAESGGNSVAWFAVARDGELALRGRVGGLHEPDGVCLSADGRLWVAQFGGDSFVCIDELGMRYAQLATPGRRAVACWLSEDEQTLFCISAETSSEQLLRGESRARLEAVSLPAR